MEGATSQVELRERLEAAHCELGITYYWKVRLHNAGLRFYSAEELYEDIYGIAAEHGLFTQALWSYFRVLHPRPPYFR